MQYELFIASRYMRSREKSRFISIVTFISIGGISVGVAALIIVLSVMNGFESDIRKKIVGTTSHITVSSFDRQGLHPDDSLYDKILGVKGVVAASPVVQGKIAISSPYGSDGVVVRGVDPVKNKVVSDIHENMIVGSFEFGDREKPGIVLGVSLADNLNVNVGDRVTVFSLNEADFDPLTSRPVANHYYVEGLFETGMYEYDGSLVYMSLEEAQWLFGMGEQVSFIDVKTQNIYEAASIAKKIDNELGYLYFASDWSRTHKNLFSWMTLEKWAMFLALSLIIAVAGFNIISNLIMIVLEKKKDIGILRALGAQRTAIRKIFIIKGLMVGIIGLLSGSILGLFLCFLQNEYSIISLPAEIYFINKLPVKIDPLDLIGIVGITLIITYIASLYPANRAASLAPAEVIRYE
ncbi:MAG: lipoprotein-releasing ABC transporter permease subunit [candidate division Zixibacteria bacterium]|nr:lipoprotein-releasing ABC transporter permease subunit [candidate division Zixibacteria bacterium]